MSDYNESKKVRGYRLDVTIGVGGFGTVFHAFQEILKREVAVKVIKEKYVNDPQFVRQFEAEARIIARMEHFNIVPLYDYWRDPSGAYLVMRWLRGGSLRSYLKQSRLETTQIVRIINQTASALSFAHQHNVIHRDIKPENILLDEEGNAFLTDFGIAVDLRNQDNVNVENISFGSPDYVAPEQLKEKIITPRSDIYSLGIMLYELLASERPFVSRDPKEIMKMQLYNPVPSLRLKRPDLPPEIDTVIWQSTAKNPAHRYDNVLELAMAFQNIASRMEKVPQQYIINTQVHNRVAIRRPLEDASGNRVTEQIDDDMSTGKLPEYGGDALEDALHTNVMGDAYETLNTPDFEMEQEASHDAYETLHTPDFEMEQEASHDAYETLHTPDLEMEQDANDIYETIHTPLNLIDDDATEVIGTIQASDDRTKRPEKLSEDSFNTPIPEVYEVIPDYVDISVTNKFGDFSKLMTMTLAGEAPPNPYKGLLAFEEADEGSFFGREEVVADLVRDFDENKSRFLALIGASGSGKSSLVRAGMIPAFRRGAVTGSNNWFYSTMVPGDNPIRELSEAILRVAIISPENWGEGLHTSPQGLHQLLSQILPDDNSELLLFIDQFEEVFTLGDSEERRELFLNSLWYAINQKDSRLRLIITLRADFYDRPLYYPQFGQMLKEHTEVVLPLGLQELESAILGPAGRVGLLVEPALKNAILDGVHNQPGALPLLQYALTELYDRKPAEQHHLTLADYLKIGGIEGALAKRAQEIYINDLTDDEQNITRKLFLRIIAIDDNGTVTRRRILWTEMMAGIENQETLQKVIDAFSKHRLLTQDLDQLTRSPTLEVAHEALIKSWKQLGQWIEQNRVDLQKRQELRLEVDRWILNGREKSYLAQGVRLSEFERLVNNDLLALREEELNFINDGITARALEEARKQRNNTILRVFSAVTFTLFIVAMVAFAFANVARADAVAQAQISRSRELAASSIANEDLNDLALLLAVESYHIADTYESRNSLLLALQKYPLVTTYFHGQDAGIRALAIDNTGNVLVSGGLSGNDNTIIRRDLTTGEIIGEPMTGHSIWINDLEVSPDNRFIASASNDATVRIWDFETGEELSVLEGHEDAVRTISFDPLNSNRLASAGDDGKIIIYNLETGDIDIELDAVSATENGNGIVFSVDFNSDGTRLISGGDDNLIRVWDSETGELITEISGHKNWVTTVKFDPTDAAIISGDKDGLLFFFDAESGELLTNPIDTEHDGGIKDMSLSFDGAFLATAGEDGRVIIWSLSQRGGILAIIDAHQNAVWTVVFNPLDYRLFSAGEDGDVLLSQLSTVQRPAELLFTTNQTINEFAVNVDTQRFVLTGEPFGQELTATIQVLDSEAIELLYEINISEISKASDGSSFIITDLALQADGTIGAVSIATGEIAVWDMASGDLIWIENEHLALPKELEISPDGSRIISADETGTVFVWDVATGDLIETNLHAPESGVTAMAISPDGNYLAIGGRGDIILWNLEDETIIAEEMLEHSDAITSLLFDANSEMLFSGSRDRTIVQWTTSGDFVQRFSGHNDWVLSLALNPAGDTLASGDRAGNVRLRELATGRPIGNALKGPPGWLTALNFMNDDTLIGSNRENAVALTWTLNLDDWVALACDISNRELSPAEWMQFFQNEDYNPTCADEAIEE